MNSHPYNRYPDPRSPFSPWLLVALIGIVLVMATLSTSFRYAL